MTTQRLALDEMLSMLREDDTVVVARFLGCEEIETI